jgi:acyl-coenzyme A synthetase/AMP-(fatty) acid ligase
MREFTPTPLEGTSGSVTPLLTLLFGVTSESVYLSPRPSTTLLRCGSVCRPHALGATVVAMEHFDPEQYLALVERHRITTSRFVPTMFVRMLKLPEEVRQKYDVRRCSASSTPRAVPDPGQEADDRVVRPIIHEYYAGTEGNRVRLLQQRHVARASGAPSARRSNCTLHIVGEDRGGRPRSESGTIYFEGGASFEYHNDPRRRRRRATRRAGRRSATSATSTTTTSSTSPTARRT